MTRSLVSLAAVVVFLGSCGPSTNKKLLDKLGYGTNETDNVSIEFKGSTFFMPKVTGMISGNVDVWQRFPDVPNASSVSGYVFEYAITPAQTFSPLATVSLPDMTSGAGIIGRADNYGDAWTFLATSGDGGVLSAQTDRFAVYAVFTGVDAGFDAGAPPTCSGTILATCILATGSNHNCTQVYGAIADTQDNCAQAGGAWDAGSTPCASASVIGHCVHSPPGYCTSAVYYSDGLTAMFAKIQCEAGAGYWSE